MSSQSGTYKREFFNSVCYVEGTTYYCPVCRAVWSTSNGFSGSGWDRGSTHDNMQILNDSYGCIAVTIPSDATPSTVFSFSVATRDGRHRDNISFSPSIRGNAAITADNTDLYIAQKTTLRISSVPSGVSALMADVSSGSDVISLATTSVGGSSGGSVVLSALKAGTATVRIKDAATSTVIGTKTITVNAPTIKTNGLIYMSRIDGTPQSVEGDFYYTKRDGSTRLSRGTDFDETLYDQLLDMQYEVISGGNLQFTSAGQLSVSSVRTNGTVWTTFPSTGIVHRYALFLENANKER